MSKNFYLTLLSNSSKTYFPDNTTSNFCTQLPKTTHLEGEWVVGLTEIQYPCSFASVRDGDNILYFSYNFNFKKSLENLESILINDERFSMWVQTLLSSGEYGSVQEIVAMCKKSKSASVLVSYKSKIDAGNYESIESLITTLNSNKFLVKDNVTFALNSSSRNVIVTGVSEELIALKLSPKLGLQLGFDPETNVLNKTSIQPSNLQLGLPSQFFIYTDIIEPQLVGDVLAKVLRIIGVDNSKYVYGTQQTQFFANPHYIPVLKREFENLEIDIRTSNGEKMPFLFGTVCTKLHFKKL